MLCELSHASFTGKLSLTPIFAYSPINQEISVARQAMGLSLILQMFRVLNSMHLSNFFGITRSTNELHS